MSYPLAAFVAGALARRGFDRRYLTSVLAMALGLVVIYTCGTLWLAYGSVGRTADRPRERVRHRRRAVRRRRRREARGRGRHRAGPVATSIPPLSR